jgi:hypothetical protein
MTGPRLVSGILLQSLCIVILNRRFYSHRNNIYLPFIKFLKFTCSLTRIPAGDKTINFQPLILILMILKSELIEFRKNIFCLYRSTALS